MMKKRQAFVLMLLCWAFFAVSANAQRTITGKVTSSNNDEALPGVSIVVKGTTKGTITDIDGAFSLAIPQDATTLTITSVGFMTKDMQIGLATEFAITLDEDTKNLGEVIVTAFGISRAKKGLSYAAQDVNSAQLNGANEQNVINALQGQVAGAMITSASGAPGAGSAIVLRGINSLDPSSNNQPLIVLDGIIISNATNVSTILPSSGSNALGGSAEQVSNTNRLADINPNDIETISVLK